MKYISLNHNSAPTSFRNAVINGLAPDKGLYFPEKDISLSKKLLESLYKIEDIELCYEVIKDFVGDEIPKNKLIDIISNTISFEIPVKEIENSIYSLELFHGPTLAFKDVGAKFMALCLDYFKDKDVTVIPIHGEGYFTWYQILLMLDETNRLNYDVKAYEKA